jgi:O-antigen/teichoic acid export membrane protein
MQSDPDRTAVTDSIKDAHARPLRARAMRASAITVGGHLASQLLRIGSNMTLTRLLFPEAFGVMALVQVVLTGLEMISDVGIQPSIVQHARGEEPAFLNTAWTIQAIRGFSLWLGGMAVAAPFAWFYGEPQLAALIPVAAVSAALSGLNSPKLALLSRRMAVGPSVLIDLAAQIGSIVLMIGLALAYRSLWALVAGGVFSSAIKMVLSHLVLPGPRNRFQWERAARRDLVRFGKWIFLSTLVTFVAMRLDIFLLGRLLPLDRLGVYSIAGVLAGVPQQLGGRLAGTVLFPVLARAARESREQMMAQLRGARRVLLPGSLLMVLGIALLAPALFRHLYDDRYHDAGWMNQLMMISAWFSLLNYNSARTLLAIGNSRSLATSNVVRLLVTASSCVLGFWLADLPGLILGVGVGSLGGYLSLLVALEASGLPVAREDLLYSLGGLASGCLAVWATAFLVAHLPWLHVSIVEAGVAAGVLGPLAVATLMRARRS